MGRAWESLLCISEGEDLEISGAFLERGTEEDKTEEEREGRDESAGWLGKKLWGESGREQVPEGCRVARALLCFMFKMFTMKLFAFR